VSPSETHAFVYDTSYRVSSSTQGSRGTISYTYTPADRIATTSIAGGPTTAYAYHPDGSLGTIEWSPISGTFQYACNLRGQNQSLTFPNGQARTYTYDDQGRLTQLANALGGTTLAAYAYGYDVNHYSGLSTMLGQRTSLSATVPAHGFSGAISKYYYDALYQLNRVDYPSVAPFNGSTDSFTYDSIGNRLTYTVNGTTQTYAYYKNGANPLNGQRLQNDGTQAYGYDLAGNLTSRAAFAFNYDIEQRLTSITASGAPVATYGYDFKGRRSSKTASGTSTAYLYDGINLAMATTGGVVASYLNGPGIDEPLATYQNGAVSFLNADGLGSVTANNDAGGTVNYAAAFDAWGVTRGQTGTPTHPFTFTGRETGEAGLLYYRARYYDPSLGRFTQEDPVGARALMNQLSVGGPTTRAASDYAMTTNDPVRYRDPTGAMILLPPGLGFNLPCIREAFEKAKRLGDSAGYRYAHCITSCALVNACGMSPLGAATAGYANELWQVLKCKTAGETCHSAMAPIDFDDNAYGYLCPPGVPCEQKCAPLRGENKDEGLFGPYAK
jgi:RHS repeat-associated protein